MKSSIFGAYDIRGKYPNEINEKVVGEIIPAIFKVLKVKKSGAKIVVGHDVRLSSPSLYKAVIRTLKSLQTKNYKLQTITAGMITTPMLYFLVNKLKAAGGIMITASHNPKNYNGLKVVGHKATPISGKEIYGLYKSLR